MEENNVQVCSTYCKQIHLGQDVFVIPKMVICSFLSWIAPSGNVWMLGKWLIDFAEPLLVVIGNLVAKTNLCG